LPAGWLGKNWACQQLAREAQGEVLVFCDADVQWKPGALSHIVAGMQHFQADMLTVWPTQKTLSWAERLVVPLMNFVLLAYLPELCVRFIPWTIFAAANGQCLVFKRSSYQLIGGHQQVRKEIVEDVALARECKRKGQKLVMLLGDGLIGCRMYRNWDEVRQGFAKNILAGHLNSPAFLLASAIFHWSLFILPWLWLFTGWAVDLGSGWPWFPLVLISLGLGCRALTARTAGNKMRDAILMPVSVCLLTVIAGQSLWWNYRHGGPRWKGRQIQQER
jgi:chlorobactene glucosyltransferase